MYIVVYLYFFHILMNLFFIILFVLAKIRRLYDIANILTSLLLIQKVHVAELRGRKPAFQYIGPDIPEIKHEGERRYDFSSES